MKMNKSTYEGNKMQKVILVTKSVIKEIDWDGTIPNLIKNLGGKIYPDSKLCIDNNYTYLKSEETYESALFALDTHRMDQEVLVIGLSNIEDGEPLASLEDVKTRVEYEGINLINGDSI